MPRPILIIQGAQYGSESKGMVAGALALDRNTDIAVRTGSVNAGHTVYYKGERCVMQQLPVAWVNPNTHLVLGAGAYVHPEILEKECALVQKMTGEDPRKRLTIDANCGIHSQMHTTRAGKAGRHYTIGATGKGGSEAIVDKISNRGLGGQPTFAESAHSLGYKVACTSDLLNVAYNKGAKIMLEGTQGTLLDLHHGPYPYTTSRMTSAANWIAEAGLSPALEYEVVHVIRTYPIRVAGPSGPLPLEISWPTLMRRMNHRLASVGKEPIMPEAVIAQWEWAVSMAAKNIPMPRKGERTADGLDMHEWSLQTRKDYAIAASELHRRALDLLAEEDAAAFDKVMSLFEMTTVTKKLRRIAEMNYEDIRKAMRIDRPSWSVLTFLNYKFPEHWGETNLSTGPWRDITVYLETLRQALGAEIRAVTTGPLHEHFLYV